MTRSAWCPAVLLLLVGGCGSPPGTVTERACWRLARTATVEVLQSGAGATHAVVLSAVVPGEPAGGVPGAEVPGGWQLAAATEQPATVEGDPVVRSRTYASRAEGSVGLTFAPPPQDRYPTAVDLDLRLDFPDTAGRVSRWAIRTSLPVERCE